MFLFLHLSYPDIFLTLSSTLPTELVKLNLDYFWSLMIILYSGMQNFLTFSDI